jgi:hypothetical protein
MVESRETRASAAEVKFVVDAATGTRIREWARSHMEPDPYGTGPYGDEYHTSTLYFDTEALDVFHRRGSYGRAKYRVRRYSSGEHIFLERKLRKPDMVVKRRTRALLNAFDLSDPASLNGQGQWFFSRLAVRRLQPACVITYDRMARGGASDDGPVRLTLDQQLHVLPADGFALASSGGEPIFRERMILELKCRGRLPALFRRLVETFLLEPQPVSKYRLGMTSRGDTRVSALGSADETEPMRR